mmetsp:Transcript_26539/g.49593  ORF Transcript_26539/g.49593 Transcript_26539/m.49593 type:complete len:110 (-) Transcript_26539:192-521(-)|eukprot:CAMPEP_0170177938 /NCGR_PEP_ID=MMETSP0040_2-20121228/11430_1 /TAXON_ID=641309 /ORGANISM="Lotharella oceanica, Strain CCMP622" /LENGTH=109 /DNA_ID=CAMNT_0010420831 /DNA_START=39 /DNA_END=371 /DNA_ORIENTATION=+
MDFVGQRLADRMHQIITAFFGIIGFIYGYFQQRFAFTMYISMVGLAISALLCVPDWGFLNSNPLKWQKPMGEAEEEDEDDGEEEDHEPPQKTKQSKSKKQSKNKVKKRK